MRPGSGSPEPSLPTRSQGVFPRPWCVHWFVCPESPSQTGPPQDRHRWLAGTCSLKASFWGIWGSDDSCRRIAEAWRARYYLLFHFGSPRIGYPWCRWPCWGWEGVRPSCSWRRLARRWWRRNRRSWPGLHYLLLWFQNRRAPIGTSLQSSYRSRLALRMSIHWNFDLRARTRGFASRRQLEGWWTVAVFQQVSHLSTRWSGQSSRILGFVTLALTHWRELRGW